MPFLKCSKAARYAADALALRPAARFSAASSSRSACSARSWARVRWLTIGEDPILALLRAGAAVRADLEVELAAALGRHQRVRGLLHAVVKKR